MQQFERYRHYSILPGKEKSEIMAHIKTEMTDSCEAMYAQTAGRPIELSGPKWYPEPGLVLTFASCNSSLAFFKVGASLQIRRSWSTSGLGIMEVVRCRCDDANCHFLDVTNVGRQFRLRPSCDHILIPPAPTSTHRACARKVTQYYGCN